MQLQTMKIQLETVRLQKCEGQQEKRLCITRPFIGGFYWGMVVLCSSVALVEGSLLKGEIYYCDGLIKYFEVLWYHFLNQDSRKP